MAVLTMNIYSRKHLALFLLITYTLTPLPFLAAIDIITPSQNLTNAETLVSSGGMFELGFFTTGNSSRNWYLGMWYRNLSVRTYVWVANREAPLTNTSGAVLRFVEPGILVLLNSSNGVVWSTTNTSRSVRNPVAQLLDSGNLVVRDSSNDGSENPIWQSFDNPTDTYLPGMKVGWNLATGRETYLVSWRSDDDPAPGNYTWRLDKSGFPQLVLKRGTDIVYRFGPWNGILISGSPNSLEDPTLRVVFMLDENEVFYKEEALSTSVIARYIVRFGTVERLTSVDGAGWLTSFSFPTDICDTYRMCGAYGMCNVGNSPICGCLDRFEPRNHSRWIRGDWSSGCVRRTNLSCRGDVFLRYPNVKLPDTRSAWYDRNMTIDECRAECSRNCSCMAYTQLDIGRRTGCLIWYEDLIDIKSLSSDGQDIYIRMASSEAARVKSGGRRSRSRRMLAVSLTSVIGLCLLGLSLFLCFKMGKNKTAKAELHRENQHRDLELPWFDLSVLFKATSHFSFQNKLGEGGFGPVYKGTLEGGTEIAVKRLSKDSLQGLDELKNEVMLIAKLQHRNLVRLLGCCIQGEDNMLIYEYMPNKSLDGILFDETKGKLLDWPTRFKIINGIARGLMYLHQDSRLRVIHRDLKASNILLDSDMTPKISDFGLARSFVGNELQANTNRVIGTYGYMSPEYAVDGLFSVKSDVFSFGVLVLEIATGRRNRGFSHREHHHNLIGHAWILYREGRSQELIDPNIGDSCSMSEVIKSIHIGLLCVQKHPEDRPNMSSVVYKLGKEVELPQAKEPGFFSERTFVSASSKTGSSGPTEMTISLLEAR